MAAQAMVGADTLVGFYAPSGEYPNYSGTAAMWIGQVQEITLDQNEGRESYRYVGNDRNLGGFLQGKREYTGTIRYYPQDMKMLGFALGSCAVTTGSMVMITETGGRIYWGGLELYNGNANATTGLLRRVNGFTIDTFKISGKEGAPIEFEIGYNAGSMTNVVGGTKPTLTVNNSTVPFMWDDTRITISGVGTAWTDVLHPVKDFSWELNNNLENPFYCDSTPFKGESIPGAREYTVDMTLNMVQTSGAALYDTYYYGGSQFNLTISLIRNGTSDVMNIVCSGCKMTAMEIPLPMEGPTEQTCTIIPQSCSINGVDISGTTYPNWALAK